MEGTVEGTSSQDKTAPSSCSMENDNNEEENPPTNDGPPSRLMITKMVSISLNDIPKSNGSDNARLEYIESLTNSAHHRLPHLFSQSLSLSHSQHKGT